MIQVGRAAFARALGAVPAGTALFRYSSFVLFALES
jgi:hypothetical protein